MSRITWDSTGDRRVESGINHGVFYPYNSTSKKYTPGVAWNGLTSVSESPDGADAQDLYADNIKYATLRGAENQKGTIKAYTYPDEFMECDGTAKIIAGVYAGQQTRKTFGMSYVTKIGSDTDTEMSGEKLHLVYGMTVSPSDREYSTINDNPDAIEFSWEYETIPVDIATETNPKLKPTAIITIDSSRFEAGSAAMAAYESLLTTLYGVDAVPAQGVSGQSGYVAAVEAKDPCLPDAKTVIAMFEGKATTKTTQNAQQG